MAIDTRWYSKPYVFYIRLHGNVTGEDMHAAVAESQKAVAENPGKSIHSITDLTEMTKMPLSLSQIAESVKQLKGNTVNGWALMIGHQNPLVKMIGAFLAQLFGYRYRAFDTLEQGLTFLNELDEILPPLLPIDSEFSVWLAERKQQAAQEITPT